MFVEEKGKMQLRLATPLLLFFAPLLGGQDSALTVRDETAKIVPGMPGGMIMGQAECDDRGNLYFRQILMGGRRAMTSPVVRIDAGASHALLFDFNSLNGKDGIDSLQVLDFSVQDSTLYLLATAADDNVRVLAYAPDGQLKQVLTLDHGVSPRKLAVMPSGEFLVFGIATGGKQDPKDPSSFVYSPVARIYDRTGRFAANVEMKLEGVNLNDSKVAAGDKFQSVDLALAGNGADGVYLLTYAQKPRLYVVSPAGEVVRHFELWTPEPDLRPFAMRVKGTQLLVEFSRFAQGNENSVSTFVTYNSYSGDHISVYRLAGDTGGIFGCYDWRGGFTFFGSSHHQLIVRHAAVRGL
jgi:hypothetical protein